MSGGWGDLLARIKGRSATPGLDHLSPFSVPMILEIGKQRSPGGAGEMILAEAAEDPDRRGHPVELQRLSPLFNPSPLAGESGGERREARSADGGSRPHPPSATRCCATARRFPPEGKSLGA